MNTLIGIFIACLAYGLYEAVIHVRRRKRTDYDCYYRHKDGHTSEPPY